MPCGVVNKTSLLISRCNQIQLFLKLVDFAPVESLRCEFITALGANVGWMKLRYVAGNFSRTTLALRTTDHLVPMKALSNNAPTFSSCPYEDEGKLKWNQGEWTRLRPEEWAVRQAFVNIGIEPDSTSGATIPENQINIYVGHERADPSAPTEMTREFENLRRQENENPGIKKLLGAK